MGLSDRIETFILHLLSDEDDWIELRRNELASIFDCVPSQINYVLSTRFTASNGYMTESRRGGGGYLRIRKINSDNMVADYISSVGDDISASASAALLASVYNAGYISQREYEIILAAVSDRSIIINQPYKNRVRAEILKNTLSRINERTVSDNV